MGQTGPGLKPGDNNQTEVEMNIEGATQAESTVSEQAVNEPEAQPNVSENTEASKEADVVNEAQAQEQPMSNRAQERIQNLANEKAMAEARAAQAEAMLKALVNVQPAQPSQDEMLAKQYKSFDQSVGYPTDPKEFLNFSEQRSRLAAQEESLKLTTQAEEQRQIAELTNAYPDADDALLGAIASERAAALKQGTKLTYRQAADVATKKLEKRFADRQRAEVAQDAQSKNEAYVEGTKGASTNRGSTIDPDKMTTAEKEAFLKANGLWD